MIQRPWNKSSNGQINKDKNELAVHATLLATRIPDIPRKRPAVVMQSIAVKLVVKGIRAGNVHKEGGVNALFRVNRFHYRIDIGDFGTLRPISLIFTKLVNTSQSTSSLTTSRLISCFQKRSTKRRRSRSGQWRLRRRGSVCVWRWSTLQVGTREK